MTSREVTAIEVPEIGVWVSGLIAAVVYMGPEGPVGLGFADFDGDVMVHGEVGNPDSRSVSAMVAEASSFFEELSFELTASSDRLFNEAKTFHERRKCRTGTGAEEV